MARGICLGLVSLVLGGAGVSKALAQAGSVDTTFNVGTGPDGVVYALAYAGNRYLVAGDFLFFGENQVDRLVRVYQSGTVDPAFGFWGANGTIWAVAVQPSNGRIVIGGEFTDVGGTIVGSVAQLMTDGSVDFSFAPAGGANDTVYALGVYGAGANQGKVLIGGRFTQVNNTNRLYLARLNANGTLDTGFDAGTGPNGTVYKILVLPDEKVLIAGAFTAVNSTNRNRIARLNADGSLDTTFNPGLGANDIVFALARQSDDKVLVGGLFTSMNGTNRNYVARLNADGSLDTTFLSGQLGADDFVSTISLQTDGKVVIGGGFAYVNGFNRNRLARLNADGTLDTSINTGTGADNFLWTSLVDAGGRILIGGGLTAFNGTPVNYLARLHGGALTNNGQLAFTSPAYSVQENGAQATITVQRFGGLNGEVTVRFAATNGSANPGIDYVPTNGVLTFAPGMDLQTFTVSILDDALVDGDKTIDLVLSDPTGGATLIAPTNATLTIGDDDGVVGFDFAGYQVNEGAESATITVSRTGSTMDYAFVDYTTLPGTATPGADYTPQSGVLIFGPGEVTASFTVPILDDTLMGEGNETVFLALTNPIGAITLGQAMATLVIIDNDFGPGMVEFAQERYNVDEEAGTASITVVRRNGSSGIVSLWYATTNGTALAPQDYAGRTNSLTFVEGQTSKIITVPIVNDPLIEGHETFQIRLYNPIGGVTLGRSLATVRIIDNDFPPGVPGSLELDADSYTVNEDAGTLLVTVLRTGGTNGTAAVNYSTYNGQAQSPNDYLPASGLLVFEGTERAKTFEVPIVNDYLGEGNEYFYLEIYGATNAALGIPSFATVTILDDEILPGSLGFSVTNFTVREGAGSVRITVIRTNGFTGPVGVSLTTGDDTAFDGTDYEGGLFTLFFDEGQSFASQSIDILNNSETNENKRFFVYLSNPTNGATLLTGFETATVTILDDDYEPGIPGVFSIESASYTTNENAPAVVLTIIRQWGRTDKVDLQWTTRDGTARSGRDYDGGETNTVTFDDGDTRKTIKVDLIDNTILDGAREFTVRLLTNGLPTDASLGEINRATVTILDDDRRWGDVRFVAEDYSVGEEGGYATITVARYGGNFGTVYVDYVLSNGTAVAGVDYTNVTGTLVFYASYSLTQAVYETFTIPIVNDNLTNGPRTLHLTLVNLTNQPPDAAGGPTLSRSSATLTIHDDEQYVTTPAEGVAQFRFSKGHYYQTDREGYYGYYYGYYEEYPYGAMLTVVRIGNPRGRAYVDYEIFDPFDPYATNYYYGGYYYNWRGTLVFDDYQMSTNIFVGYSYYYYYYTLTNQNRVLYAQLSNPRGAPGEPTPTLGLGSSAAITVLNTTRGFNFVNAVTRVPEWVGDASLGPECRCVRLGISREIIPEAVTVEWKAPDWRDYSYRSYYYYYYDDDYYYYYYYDYLQVGSLQSGSDFALPPHGGHIGDYTPRSGTLSWADDDFDIKYIEIPITQDDEVEFNEDFFVYLSIPKSQKGKPGETLGPVSVAVVTILADDSERILDLNYLTGNAAAYANEQPAGAADLTWNRDRSLFTMEPNPRNNHAPGANNRLYALAVQPDGKVLLAGEFTGYNAQGRNRIARTDIVGGIDLSFDPGTGADDYISALGLYETGPHQGKIIIGGGFTSFNGQSRYGVARLNANGSLDYSFSPGSAANGPVRAVAIQTDGKVIIGGDFAVFDGTNRYHIARLNVDGSLDTSFDPGSGTDGPIYAVALSGTNGQVVIGGSFDRVNGQLRSGIARLHGNGSLDTSFDTGGSINGRVYAVAVQADGRVIIGGDFTEVNLQPRRRIARLQVNGWVDDTFNPGTGFDDIVYGVTLQPDGKPLVGGLFRAFDGTRRAGIARLFDNGTLDTSFMDTAYNQYAGLPISHSFDPPGFVSAVAYQSDGTNEYVLIGGSFTRVGGGYTRSDIRFRSNIARLIGGATPGPGNIAFSRDDYGTDESGTSASFTLRRNNGGLGAVTVSYRTEDLTATAGYDYGSTFNSVTWPAFYGDQLSDGDTRSYVLTLPIYDDGTVEGNETFALTLVNPSTFFNLAGEPVPVGTALGRSLATFTIVDDDFTPGVLGFSAPTFTVNEHESTATITLIRTNGNTGRVTVNYTATSPPPGPGAATAGLDYTAVSGTLSFDSGETNKTFTVDIVNDTDVELDEAVILSLSLPTGGATLGLATATLLIIDNDFLPGRLNFIAPNFTANENAGSATVTVSRFGGNFGALSVRVATSDGTATAGLDYTGVTNHALTWADGDSAPKSFTIPLVNDGWVDPDETVQLWLYAPSDPGALGALTNATLTILDDDFYGTFAFSAANYNANENGGQATITVVRTNGAAETATVEFATLDGTTNSLGSYVSTNGVLTFTNGETAKQFVVPLLDNAAADGTRIVLLTLTNSQPAGALLGFPNPASLTIIDDESANVPAGSVDTSFRPNPGPNGPVYALARNLDGTLLIGGDFNQVDTAARNRLARLLPNGLLDFTFDPGTGANGSVRGMALQSDGKVLIGGFFTTVNGVPLNYVARLNTGGSVDSSFNPGSGLDNPAYALAIQRINNQERVLIGGGFTTVNGVRRSFIARLLPNGSLDQSFNPPMGANATVFALAVQPDGKILIGGDFTTVDNTNRNHIARLNVDGSLDLSFNPGPGANASVRAIAVQSDGKILLGGLFTQINGTNWNHFARLNPNGALDPSFNPGVGADNLVYAVALQEDGKIVLGGDFTACNGVTRNRITRLNADGTVDPTINFGTGANSFVAVVRIQPDGKIVIGGGFTTVNGVARNHVARLHGGSLTGSGSLEFSSPEYAVSESGVQALVAVRRTGGTLGQVSVRYATTPGTASPGDYTAVSGLLTFPTGETWRTFTVPVFDDQVVNLDKTVNLILSNFVGAVPGPQPVATLRIVNDDSLIGFQTATFSVNENALGGRAQINVTRAGSTQGSVAVDYATVANGTATTNADFIPVSGTLFFGPGQSNLSFTISILDDTDVEGNETLGLSLFNLRGAALPGQTNAQLAIVDNDFAPGRIVFSRATYTVSESAGSATISVLRTNGSTGIVSAEYATSDGSAAAGLDYLPRNGLVAFADGQTSNTFLVPINWDTTVEPDETVNLRLFNPTSGATIGSPSIAVLTIVNEGGFPPPGTLISDFNATSGANNFVRTVAVQPDGRLIIGGAFTRFAGVARNFIARLNADGSLDTGFNPGMGADALVWCTALQPDGKVLLGGAFLRVNNTNRTRLAQLTSSGSLDAGFNPVGVNAIAYAVAPHNGGVLVGGAFDFSDTLTTNLARFQADGSRDNVFNAYLDVDGPVHALAVQPDHRVILGGNFTRVRGIPRRSLARLNGDGTLDTSFGSTQGVAGIVFSVALQTNGQFVIGGMFSAVHGITNQNNVARLQADGSLDTSFAPPGGVEGTVYSVAVQPDRKILIGGDFVRVNGFTRNRIARLTPEGLLDQGFVVGSGADGTVYSVVLQPDQRVVIAGDFTSVNGEPHDRVAQLLGGDLFDPASMRFVSTAVQPNGDVLLTLQSQPGHVYALDVSVDLLTWSLFDVRNAVGNTLTFTDRATPGQRFYRARRLGP